MKKCKLWIIETTCFFTNIHKNKSLKLFCVAFLIPYGYITGLRSFSVWRCYHCTCTRFFWPKLNVLEEIEFLWKKTEDGRNFPVRTCKEKRVFTDIFLINVVNNGKSCGSFRRADQHLLSHLELGLHFGTMRKNYVKWAKSQARNVRRI